MHPLCHQTVPLNLLGCISCAQPYCCSRAGTEHCQADTECKLDATITGQWLSQALSSHFQFCFFSSKGNHVPLQQPSERELDVLESRQAALALSVTFQSIPVNHPLIPKWSKLSQPLSSSMTPQPSTVWWVQHRVTASKSCCEIASAWGLCWANGWEDEEDASQHWPSSYG